MQRDIGKLTADARKKRRQHADRRRIDGSDLDRPRCLAGSRSRHVHREPDISNDPHRPIVEHLPCPRQLDPARRPLEQPHTEFLLQRLDVRTQRWLGNAHPRRRPIEVQLLGHCNEEGKLAKFHGNLL
ncbi:hypothetical protein N182_35055 [Sinorhizobium sp. GL2]|nr:hypothetical protein N182_35055 [Sinorhizobium sp. GL2]